MTAESLGRISAHLAGHAASAGPTAKQPTESIEASATPPAQLTRNATAPEVDARWHERKRSPYATTTTRVFLSKLTEGALRVADAEEEAAMLTYKIGRDLMELGKYDEARMHFEAVLEDAADASCSDYYVRASAGQLAWLEPDPVKASQLLALACQPGPSPTDAGHHLVDALELAERTGSEACAEAYRARLQHEAPQLLEQYLATQANPARTGEEPPHRLRNVLYVFPDL